MGQLVASPLSGWNGMHSSELMGTESSAGVWGRTGSTLGFSVTKPLTVPRIVKNGLERETISIVQLVARCRVPYRQVKNLLPPLPGSN
jgi:hypothetical protein